MIKSFERGGRFLGSYYETRHAYFFFGSRHVDKGALIELFPQYRFSFLKQVHGTSLVEADPASQLEADAHFTREPGLALVIQTADCIPLLLSDTSVICALHAGWRGVAGDILRTTELIYPGSPDVALVGPHIHLDSFEIGNDVRDRLLGGLPAQTAREQFFRAHSSDSAKSFFNLSALLKLQLLTRYSEVEVLASRHDTFTHPEYHSFRRDRERAGRQYSFVVLKR